MGVVTLCTSDALYSISSGDMLTVISPIDYLFCGFWLLCSLLVGALLSIEYGATKPAPWIWNALATLLVLSIVSANATVKPAMPLPR